MPKPLPHITSCPHPLTSAVDRPDEEKIEKIESRVKEILEILGLDLTDPSLEQTPLRVAKMYVKELFAGLKKENFPFINFFPEPAPDDDSSRFIFVKTSFTSTCEHHLMPFHGMAYVAYVPQEKVIGFSKIPRLVRYFAKRPQLQERLTFQIADALCLLLGHENVAVSVTAEHFCMISRGVEDEHSAATTHAFKGEFKEKGLLREEFFLSIAKEAKKE